MSKALRIAVVDDDRRVRESLESLFDAAQVKASFFDSAESFLARNTAEFSCLVSDIKMPQMSGYELQKALVERGDRLPIIFISAYPDEARVREAIHLGAKAFIPKPFDGEELLECIEHVLNEK